MAKLCIRCGGSGMYLGNGMMMTDCELCNEEEYEQKEAPSLDKINRNSKSYQKAIKDIMAINPDITRKEAIKMFDEAYIKG
jgi:hypothetical protein